MPRPTLSRDEVADMRRRLCDAAMELYADQGSAALSFRQLAARLDISHTLPYRYFDSKEALLAELRCQCVAEMLDTVRAADVPDQAPLIRLETLAWALVDWVQTHPARYRLLFSLNQPPLELYPRLMSARQMALDYIIEIIEAAIAHGDLHGDARTIGHVAWATLHGVLTLHAAGQLVHGRNLEQLVGAGLQIQFGIVPRDDNNTPAPTGERPPLEARS